MSTEANKAIVRRFIDGLNQGNLAIGEELLAEDVQRYLPGSAKPVGRTGSQKAEVQFYAAFPDMQSTIEELLADGDRVVVRLTVRGTHQGPFQGIAPTGRAITLTEIFIARIRDDRITHLHAEANIFGLLQQLGVMPTATRASA
jgi:steroid delta-isomerase-like uncharacterized protein